MSNVATIDRPTGPSIIATMADRYSMAPAAFEATLRATVIPKECTREQFAAFLLVANEYGLNPILKEIYAFAAKGGGIQPVVGIDGWVRLMNEHPMMDGLEFDDHLDDKNQLTAISARIYRKDRSHPMVVTEYMSECRRNTEPWKQWPQRMLRHKATIQAVRYAFGYSSILDADEAERMGANIGGMRDVSPPPAPRVAPAGPKQIASPTTPHDPDTGEVIDDRPAEVGNRQPQAEDAAGNAAGRDPATGGASSDAPSQVRDGRSGKPIAETAASGQADGGSDDTIPSSGTSAPATAPLPLSADERKTLTAFAAALAEVNTPTAVNKGSGRFYQDHDLLEGSPVEAAAAAIFAAHMQRTRGNLSVDEANAAVKKVLAL